MYSDVIETLVGSLLGTSSVTTYVESGAGIAARRKNSIDSIH
jgi:xanthine/uracil/vitamin C permease (AzgA family)